MITSEAVRKARKEAQLERLKHKGDPEFYAAQPFQQHKAKLNEAIRAAKAEVKAASDALQVALIKGTDLVTAQAQLAAASAKLTIAEAERRALQPRSGGTLRNAS